MPARKKMTPVEVLILFAILGILASIALPAMNQAQQRSRGRGVEKSRSRTAVSTPPLFDSSHLGSDGQLNTIEVSELSQNAERGRPQRAIGGPARFVPLILGITAVFVFLNWVRRQAARRRAH
jgi:hypothetical protein